MLPILNIGPLAIQLPGLFLLAGVWVGVLLLEREGRRLRLNAAALSNMLLIGLIAGVLGARLAYALRYLSVYLGDPAGLLSLNPTTLAAPEGALIGTLVAAGYASRRGLPLWPTLDALAPGLAVFSIAVGFAHLASGDAFGMPTELPWGIELWGATRHPTQIYELLLGGLILFVVLELRGRLPASGGLFLAWVGLSAGSRLLVEAFRGDSVVVLGSLRMAQLVSLGLLALALLGLQLRARQAEQKG